jgi:hypothetical protein
MQNPDPTCEKECRFSYGPTVTTAMYYSPVFDKHGNNLNPDGNTSFSEVSCYVCQRSWYTSTQYGKTTFKLIEK